MIVGLALRTGIAPSVWEAEPMEYIVTALDIIETQQREERQQNRGA